MVYGVPKMHIFLFVLTQMHITLVTLMIERLLVEEYFIWDVTWYHGSTKNKAPLLYLPLRQNMLLLHLVVLKFYGWCKHYKKFKSLGLNLYLFCMTILVPYGNAQNQKKVMLN